MRRQAPLGHQSGQLVGHLGQGECAVHQVGAQEDQEDHRRGRGRGVEAARQLGPSQLAAQQRGDEGCRSADAGAFGGREQPAVDAAEDDDEDQRDRQHAAHQAPAQPRCVLVVVIRRMAGKEAHGQRDREDVAEHRDQPRHHRRGKELGDVLLGQDRVDDQRHRRRDQDAQRAARGQRAGGQPARVAVALELRQRHLSDRRGRRHRRAADRAEGRAGHHGCHRQAAAKARHQRRRAFEQRARQAALGGEVTHQDEQRDDAQVEAGEARKGLRVQEACQRHPAGLHEVADATGDEHRHGDRHAHGHQAEHQREHRQRERHRAHLTPLRAARSGLSACERPGAPT